ncbi:hypothetical protein ACS0TY_021664 [Phlomoides rotata]
MDGRRHSVDLPISRTLVALRRVRSLRDPSTNSMRKLSSLVDNLNWETQSSNAITLGFDNAGYGGSNDNDVKLNYGSRYHDLGLVSREYVGGLVRNTREELSGRKYKKDGEVLEIFARMPSGDCVDGGDSFSHPNRRFLQVEKRCRGREKHKSWNRKQNNRSCRVRTGDVLSPVVSPCFSTCDVLKEGSRSGMSFYGNDNVGMKMESVDRGCGISSCWSKPQRTRLSNLQTKVGKRPLLVGNAGQMALMEESTDCTNNSKGNTPYLGTPRSLSQKFVPKSFKELVGQNVVVKSLLSAICNGRISSLYLFHGQRGVGKTSAARVFTAALNCLSSEINKPCGLCKECVSFFSGRSLDVKEVDSMAINGITRLRSLIIDAEIPPINSRYKVYIVDECHLLRGETWASILNKKLSPYVVFIMVCPDFDKLPSGVVSKCQSYHFQAVEVGDVVNRLSVVCEEEGLDYDEDALSLIATKSNGSVRDAEMMLDQLSLLSKKITIPLVYEVIGVVSDAELLDLLQLALSSDAPNMIKRARELTRTRVEPLQLISQLANLIMDILSGECEGVSEIRGKLFGPHDSEADMQQLRNALKILLETEKQLRMSKNQTTWLTVALLQLSSTGASHDTLNLQDGECLKHPVTGSSENTIRDDVGTLELIWARSIGICKSTSLKNLLQKRGKLVSVHLIQGVAVAELVFDHSNHMSKAAKSRKDIAAALQLVLDHNVELRFNLSNNGSNRYTKFKKPSFSLFSCSRRGMNFCAECGSNVSEYSSYTPTTFSTRDRFVEMCPSSDCGSQIVHACCHAREMITSIQNSDGNALSIGVRTPHRSLPESMERENPLEVDPFNKKLNNEVSNSLEFKPERQPRRREYWKSYCWRTSMFPFRKAQTLLEKKLY